MKLDYAFVVPCGFREYQGKGPPPGTGHCFNCGLDGHWARDCRAGDWKNKCYRCGEQGHIERECKNSPRKLKREGSYSCSPVRSCRGRSCCWSYSRGRSYSRSGSPPPKRERNVENEERSMSPDPKSRMGTPTPDEGSPRRSPGVKKSRSRSPAGSPMQANGHSHSPTQSDERNSIDDE